MNNTDHNLLLDALLYGFQFAHHGKNAAFWALAKVMRKHIPVIDVTPPFSSRLSVRWQSRLYHRWMPAMEYWLRKRLETPGTLSHYYFPENTLFRGARWKHAAAKLVMTCHMPVDSDFMRLRHAVQPGFVQGLERADAVVLMAPNDLDYFQQLAPQAQVLFIPYGIDTAFFCRRADTVPANGERFSVITVGSCMRDYATWARIVQRVRVEKLPFDFTVIAGPLAQRDAQTALGGEVAGVQFHSGLSDADLRRAYEQADVLLLPLANAWANTALLEAMSMGIPLVATDLPAVRAYSGAPGQGAWYFENAEPEQAVEHMKQLWLDPARREQAGEFLRERAVVRFDWGVIAQRHLELYRKLLAHG